MDPPQRTNWRLLAVLCLGHLLVDSCATFMTPLNPLFERHLAMAPLTVGLLLVMPLLAALPRSRAAETTSAEPLEPRELDKPDTVES